jgi:hypothetical protein
MSDLDPFQSDEWKDAAGGDLEARQNRKPPDPKAAATTMTRGNPSARSITRRQKPTPIRSSQR